jgi:hypothetical protein
MNANVHAQSGHTSTAIAAQRVDWTTLPSTYTHDSSGIRVQQHTQGIQPVVMERPDYQRSGFRHYRSTIQGGNSADHYHTTDSWGGGVRPYGEWRYPYRPYSVPYIGWGPALPLSVGQNFWGGFPPRGFFPNPQLGQMPPVGMPGAGGMGMNGMGMNPGVMFPPNMGYPVNPWGFGMQGGWQQPSPFLVGPQNALRADQDEYYAPAPDTIPPMRDREFFFNPSR